jgi:ParB-like partition proteins
MSGQKIIYIDIENIKPHFRNPRKKLNDLEELAASIKENGIMQNLTVVPWYSKFTGVGDDNGKTEDDYYVVIGHRRLAAAKLAGLTEVPCVISNMNEKQQVATMLMENMQRSDLTVIEEAEGMQMMFDMGSTAEEIAEKTGLSKTTIKRRGQLLELDREKLVESYERGGTLQNYLELNKIKDPKTKNKVLETIGTNNFDFTLRNAIRTEEAEMNKEMTLKCLGEFAEEITAEEREKRRDLQHVRYIYFSEPFEKPEDTESVKYYIVKDKNWLLLMKKREDEPEEIDKEQEILRATNEKRRERQKKIEEIYESMYELRYDFVEKLPPKTAKKYIQEIARCSVEAFMKGYGWEDDGDDLLQFFGFGELDDEDECAEETVMEKFDEKLKEMPEKCLLVTVYTRVDNKRQTYSGYRNEYENNKQLDFVYDLLCYLGYKISDEEIAMRNGTHELYNQEENEG